MNEWNVGSSRDWTFDPLKNEILYQGICGYGRGYHGPVTLKLVDRNLQLVVDGHIVWASAGADQNTKVELCDHCPDVSSHVTTGANGERCRFCCRCWVQRGNPPADWHPKCMAAYRETNKPIDGTGWAEQLFDQPNVSAAQLDWQDARGGFADKSGVIRDPGFRTSVA